MSKQLKNFIWLLVLMALSAVTLNIVVRSSGDFSFADFRQLISKMNPFWIAMALLCSFGFIYFEALGLRYTCRFFAHPTRTGEALLYSAADFYFSGITPTAAGGQPAALLVMTKHGVPTAISAMALMLNLVMYTLSLLIIGIVAFLISPYTFLRLDTFPKICVIIGALVQLFLIWCYLMCMFKDKVVLKICDGALKFLCKLHLLRNYEQKREKLVNSVSQYAVCGEKLRREKVLPRRVLLCNLAQRMSIIMVPVCVFFAMGGGYRSTFNAMSAQTLAILGSNAIPLPGAVGISDYLFLKGFSPLISTPVSLDLLSRCISFFLPLILCGIAVFFEIFRANVAEKRHNQRTINFVFNKKMGKPFKWVITSPAISLVVGWFMDTRLSKLLINRFVRNNEIDTGEYIDEKYRCFNDFFTRRIKPELRPVDFDSSALISPCDGMMSAYHLTPDCEFSVKNSYYTAYELIHNSELAKRYENGICLVLRLGVNNYHRYCYLDDGTKSENRFIKGRYNPVMPIVSLNHPVYRQNCREYCVLHTKNFGDIVQTEVGACLVGRIINHHEACSIRRGQEKGLFQYGGSTIVLFLEKGTVEIDEEIFEKSSRLIEIPIKYGEKIAVKKDI